MSAELPLTGRNWPPAECTHPEEWREGGELYDGDGRLKRTLAETCAACGQVIAPAVDHPEETQ